MTGVDVPYWTIPRYDGVTVVPWSGEVVPVEVPSIPTDVPVVGPPIKFIGEGEHAVAGDVWNWVRSTARSLIGDTERVLTNTVTDVINIVEPYVGSHVQAAMSYVTETVNWADTGLQNINAYASDVASILFGEVNGIDNIVTSLEGEITGIEDVTLPEMFKTLFGAIQGVYADLVGGIDLVKSWAIDNIYTPLDAEIRNVEATIPVWAEGALTDAKAYADQLVHSEAAQRAAAIAGIAASVAAITTFVEECGQPMCDYAGPNTDLGKLLKALHLAADLAIIAALMNMTEADLVSFVQTFLGRTAHLVGDVEQFLAPGGETVTGLVASLAKDVV